MQYQIVLSLDTASCAVTMSPDSSPQQQLAIALGQGRERVPV